MEDFDDLEDLMAEPPGGANHGRTRNPGGRWVPLELTDWVSMNQKKPIPIPLNEPWSTKRYPQQVKRHGSIYAYVKQECRCGPCRKAWSMYQKDRRARAK